MKIMQAFVTDKGWRVLPSTMSDIDVVSNAIHQDNFGISHVIYFVEDEE